MNIAFILDHSLKSYRLPFFNLFSSYGFEICVYHTGPKLNDESINFKQGILKSHKVFAFEYRGLPNLKEFEIVIHMQNIRLLSLWEVSLFKRNKYKVIHWGIGTSSSRGLHSESKVIRFARNVVSLFCDAQILYSDFALSKYPKKVQKKTFIANNTVESNLSFDYSNNSKDSILFIGSLNKRKGLDILIKAFKTFLDSGEREVKKLNIIGDGPEFDNLTKLVKSLGLEPNVNFLGNIVEEVNKIPYYKNAIASISPNQAGLSVLECFSYGIPFIAFQNAISGGEHLNIKDGENGYLPHDIDELVDRMKELDDDHTFAKELGKNAFSHYSQKRTMRQMVETFVDAINYAIKNKN